MSQTPGLIHNLRQNAQPSGLKPADEDVEIEIGEDAPSLDGDELLRIEHDDGTISISLDGRPVEDISEAEKAADWYRNIVDDIAPGELSRISEDLLTGIEDDLESRQDWIEDRAQGLKLLGLKIEIPGVDGSVDGAPVEGMSRVRHPLLLEAVLRFQANASAELLPADGPVKVRVDGVTSTLEQDSLANALQEELNHYLTAVDKAYYPDTDRMLLMLGFGGCAFKKVFFSPVSKRPTSQSVDADDLIVNNNATSFADAKRITHRVFMRPSLVKRMQILGVYRDVDLQQPAPESIDSVQREKAAQQGVTPEAANPEDRDREIYECYCELDIQGFEHKHKNKITGLEIPYCVTIDKTSREILSIVRNFDEPSGEPGDELPEARTHFVKYTFVPGMGFYDIGLLHILGNTTNAVTAAWREMLDAGMFANFPGFLMADMGARQNTNIFRVPPGGGALVKTGGLSIKDAIMPLPYKEPGGAMMNLVQNMVETGQRVGGTAELQVGEGRADVPVGTTLAMIDQANKVLNAVHKRLHTAQAEEFQLLVRVFREHPDAFLRCCRKSSQDWSEQTFVAALNDYELVPQADPNTASQTQRLMKIMGLKQLQGSNPSLYDAAAIDKAALQAMGWSNPERFMVPPPPPQMPPEAQLAIAQVQIQQGELEVKKQDAMTKRMVAQAKIAQEQQEAGLSGGQAQPDPLKMAEVQVKQQEVQQKMVDSRLDAINRQRDRESRERLAAVKLAEQVAQNPMALPIVDKILDPGMIQRLEMNENPLPPEVEG